MTLFYVYLLPKFHRINNFNSPIVVVCFCFFCLKNTKKYFLNMTYTCNYTIHINLSQLNVKQNT